MKTLPARVTRETNQALDRGRVLNSLVRGDQLSESFLSAVAGIPVKRVKRAVEQLHGWGLLRQARCGTAWEITDRGRGYVARRTGQAMIDVPRAIAG